MAFCFETCINTHRAHFLCTCRKQLQLTKTYLKIPTQPVDMPHVYYKTRKNINIPIPQHRHFCRYLSIVYQNWCCPTSTDTKTMLTFVHKVTIKPMTTNQFRCAKKEKCTNFIGLLKNNPFIKPWKQVQTLIDKVSTLTPKALVTS